MTATTALTFNPLTELVVRRHGGEVVAVSAAAPQRGRPLRIFTFSRAEDPEIFELLLRIARGGGAIDVELGDAAYARMAEAGLLVPEDQIPSSPRFRCDPRDPPRDLLPARARAAARLDERLRVNPTLRYDDELRAPEEGRAPKQTFGGAVTRGAVNPFAADCAWAWVEHPDAAAPGVLSIAEPDRDALRRLRPGERPPEDLAPDLAAALTRADVLVDPADVERRREAWARARTDAAAKLARDRYTPLRGMLHPAQVAALRRYYRQLVAEGHVRFDDRQVPLRFSSHNEPLARFFHLRFGGLVSELAGEPMKPSYVFFGTYTAGAVLEPHRDREQCALSVSLLVDYQPEPDDLSPWPLWLSRDDVAPRSGATAIRQALGDGLVYRGTELVHFRDALPEGHVSTSLFLHYVPADFAGPLD